MATISIQAAILESVSDAAVVDGRISGDFGADLSNQQIVSRDGRSIRQLAGPDGQNIFSGRDTIITSIVGNKLRTRRISDRVIDDVNDRHFVKPSGYEELQDLIWKHGLVILEAPRGTGKHALGVRLLSDCQKRLRQADKPTGGLFYIRMGWQEIEAREIPNSPGTCYLLDLSDSTDERPSLEFGEDLLHAADAARYDGVYLAVLVTADVWSGCRPVTKGVTRPVIAPNAKEIAEHHLEWKYGARSYEEWLNDSEFQELLSRIEHPSEAAKLAEAIARNLHRDDTKKAMAEVLDSFGSWRSHLTDWFGRHGTVADRAALISAAVLDPASPADILDARKKLLVALDESEADIGPLAGPGRTGYLELLQATKVKDGISISQQRHGLDEAVVLFVWDEWPQAQPILQNWLLSLTVNAPRERTRRIAQIAVRTAIQANSTAFIGLIRKIATEQPECRNLALEILDLTVLNPKVGARVRGRILGWASAKDEELAALAIEACGRLLGQERPSLALHRICRALSRKEHDRGFRAAEDALIALANDEISRSSVLDLVQKWIFSQPQAGIPAFLTLATRSRSFVADSLDVNVSEKSLSLFASGWALATASGIKNSNLVVNLGQFLDICEVTGISPDTIVQIIGPLFADSVNKSLAMRVLGQDRKDGFRRNNGSIRSHLMQELIWGQLNRNLRPAASNLDDRA